MGGVRRAVCLELSRVLLILRKGETDRYLSGSDWLKGFAEDRIGYQRFVSGREAFPCDQNDNKSNLHAMKIAHDGKGRVPNSTPRKGAWR